MPHHRHRGKVWKKQQKPGIAMKGELAVCQLQKGRQMGDLIGLLGGKVVIFDYPPPHSRAAPWFYIACRLLWDCGRFYRADCLYPFRGKLAANDGPELVIVGAVGIDKATEQIEGELSMCLEMERDMLAAPIQEELPIAEETPAEVTASTDLVGLTG